jgi:hypothetical protein
MTATGIFDIMTADELRALFGLVAARDAEEAASQLLAAGQPLAALIVTMRRGTPPKSLSQIIKDIDDGIDAGELDPLVAGATISSVASTQILLDAVPVESQLWRGLWHGEVYRVRTTDPQVLDVWAAMRAASSAVWNGFGGCNSPLEVAVWMSRWVRDTQLRRRVLAADVLGYPYLLAGAIEIVAYYGWSVSEQLVDELADALARAPDNPTMHTLVLPPVIV